MTHATVHNYFYEKILVFATYNRPHSNLPKALGNQTRTLTKGYHVPINHCSRMINRPSIGRCSPMVRSPASHSIESGLEYRPHLLWLYRTSRCTVGNPASHPSRPNQRFSSFSLFSRANDVTYLKMSSTTYCHISVSSSFTLEAAYTTHYL
jgi:hypothetical protein